MGIVNYNIIQSGSAGNAVIIENFILVDCGLSFKKISPYHKDLKVVMLTHQHQDHFNKSCIKKLAKERPSLKFVCCDWLLPELLKQGVPLNNIIVVKIGEETNLNILKVTPVKAYHDVSNCGYRITLGENKILYMTDTSTMDGISAKDYDLYLLEANYGEEEIEERIAQKQIKGEFIHEHRAKDNHLSKEQSDAFLLENMGEHSKYEYMHEHREDKKDE